MLRLIPCIQDFFQRGPVSISNITKKTGRMVINKTVRIALLEREEQSKTFSGFCVWPLESSIYFFIFVSIFRICKKHSWTIEQMHFHEIFNICRSRYREWSVANKTASPLKKKTFRCLHIRHRGVSGSNITETGWMDILKICGIVWLWHKEQSKRCVLSPWRSEIAPKRRRKMCTVV